MQTWNQKTKYIFVSGGVYSSLGKGLSAASLGSLLRELGINAINMKLDPYLNHDPGTLSPYQHGEVYVTADGAETDLDLGHYERFLGLQLTRGASETSGKIYARVIADERKGRYAGRTIQVIPHVTDAIKSAIHTLATEADADVIVVEVGGTVGDLESQPFFEAIRQLQFELPREAVAFIHVVPIIEIPHSGELKTKPLQHSVRALLTMGIAPDVLFVRAHVALPEAVLKKIAGMCYVPRSNVFTCPNLEHVYLLPQHLFNEGVPKVLQTRMQLQFKSPIPSAKWHKLMGLFAAAKAQTINVALVGKYVELHDAYLSIIESLKLACHHAKVKPNIMWISSEQVNSKNVAQKLKQAHALIVPGGFDVRGVPGKIAAIKYAREHQLPFLGICLGMQLACIEYAQNVLGLTKANSTEFDAKTPDPIIDVITGKDNVNLGGTLRLGAYECTLKKGSLAAKLYGTTKVARRHRHRYEFNNDYKDQFINGGMVFSGRYANEDLQEIIELPNHPFFVGVQYHPEFNSSLYHPEELFVGLVSAAITQTKAKKS